MENLFDLLRIAQVVVGIGLVIFVHEAGHFLAARWCGVRVHVFSLGFGPRLFGWRRGATMYQVALIPLGGYVRMAGEESQYDGRPPAADELASKTVGQRFLIYSGGVIMNVLFALIVFPLILMYGVPMTRPILGPPEPGGPAWKAGIEAGSEVLAVNGNSVYDFMHIPNEVALGPSREATLLIQEPGKSAPTEVRVPPEYDEVNGIYRIRVRQSLDPESRIRVQPGTRAAEAGLQDGDRLLDVRNGDAALPMTTRMLWAMRDGAPLDCVLEREGERFEATIQPSARTSEQKILGVTPPSNYVRTLRPSAVLDELDLREEDRILTVGQTRILRSGSFLRALVETEGDIEMQVQRGGKTVTLTHPALSKEERVALAEDIDLRMDVESLVVDVVPGSAAARAGLESGDRVLKIDQAAVHTFGELSEIVRAKVKRGETLALTVARPEGDGEAFRDIDVTLGGYTVHEYGFSVQAAQYTYKAENPMQAVVVGVAHSWKFVEEAYLTLRRIATGGVRSDNVGGIITIGVVSHSWAGMGLTKLLFFLCMLSMNLAFLNVLPVPVLDGGHLMFLLIEKLKGSPVSERTFGYSQMVGLVMILSLMVYVTYNDLKRWVFD